MGSTTDVLFNLYCRLRDAGQPVSLKLWSTEGQQFFNFSLLPSSNLEPQRQWQSNNPHKPLKYKSPCRRRRDLNRLEQRRAQGAGYQVQGAGDHVQGAGDQVRGAGDQVQGAGDQVQGAGDQVQGAGDQVKGAGDQVQGAGNQVKGAGDQV